MRYFFIFLVIIASCPIAANAKLSFSDKLFDRSEFVDPWKIHLRFSGAIPMSSEDFTVNGAPTTISGTDKGILEKDFIGFDADFERFITDYISLSMETGYETSKSADLDFVVGPNTYSTSGKMSLIPVDFAINVHPAPYGDIDPYIGFGYGYNFVMNSYDGIKTSNAGGFIIRTGFDWLMSKNTSFNLDVKKKMLSVDSDYSELVGGTDLKSKTKVNPVIISAGIGYKF
jgi:outer membrane protein